MPVRNISDDQILKDIAEGNSQAMRLLVDGFGPLIWGIAKRYVRPEHHIEDLAQEIFTEIWKKAHLFDPEKSSARTFVAVITRRRSIDWVRKKTREPIIESLQQDVDAQLQLQTSMDINSETLRLALAMLSTDEQNLFKLHFQQGMTHSEISDSTGLPLGTIKTQIRRGLIKLRKKFQEIL